MRERSELEEEYRKSEITLVVNEIEVPLALSGFTGHIITASNPYSVKQTDESNDESNKRLMQDLVEMVDLIIEAVGRNKEGTWAEKGFAISGLEDEAAIEIGRKFGQNAIFKVVDGKSQVVWCN